MNLITRGDPFFRRALLVTVLTVSAVLVSGCGEPDHIYLPALQADPMAGYSHPDLEREWHNATKKHTDWKGTERSADISTYYLVDEEADSDAVVSDILNEAERAGWAIRSLEPSFSSLPSAPDREEKWWGGSKYLREGLASLTIKSEPSYRVEGRTEIWVHLDFRNEEDMPTPLVTPQRDARYAHPSELRDALEAAGVRCRLYTNETSAEIRSCNEYVWIGVFGDEEEATAVAQDRMDSGAGGTTAEYVVGQNWMVELSGDPRIGHYVVEQLGGELLGAEVED